MFLTLGHGRCDALRHHRSSSAPGEDPRYLRSKQRHLLQDGVGMRDRDVRCNDGECRSPDAAEDLRNGESAQGEAGECYVISRSSPVTWRKQG